MSAAKGRAWSAPERISHNERAQRLSRRELGICRRGDRGLLGIAVAGEVVSHAWLTADALEALGTRALAIAAEVRGSGGGLTHG